MPVDFYWSTAKMAQSGPYCRAACASYKRQERGGRAKMLLALDVGNTNAVFGLYKLSADGGKAEVVTNWRITTPTDQTADEFAILLHELFALRGLKTDVVTGVAISSVVPPLDSTMRKACEMYL